MALAPIILTAALGDADFAWADGLRRAHFPAARNQVPAHITLFHHLPPSSEAELTDRMKAACATPPPPARLRDIVHLGQGVAFRVECDALMAIRDELAQAFHGLLTPQDMARPRLHITIQNKVSAADSRALADALRRDFRPRPIAIVGLSAWRYEGGPWAPIRTVRFRG